MSSTSFWDHPVEKLEEALSLRKQIASLQSKLSDLFGGATPKLKPVKRGGKRPMSAEGRERIAAAQRARWAKSKGGASPVAPKGSKKRSGLTPEGRARLAASMKARWAARKKGTPALNVPGRGKAKSARKGKRTMSPEAKARISAAAKKRWAEKRAAS